MPLQRHGERPDETSGHLSETVHIDQWLRLLVVLAACLLIVASLVVAIRLLGFIAHTLLIFSLAGLLAYAFAPLVDLARRRGAGVPRPRWFGVLVVYGGMSLAALIAIALLSGAAVHQVSELARNHVQIEADVRERLKSADAWLESRNVHVNLEETINHPPPNVQSWGEATAQTTLKVLSEASKSVLEGVIVVLISVYFL